MIIAYHNVWSKVLEATEEEFDWLEAYLSCEVETYNRSINWSPDEVRSLFQRSARLLPSGFMKILPDTARAEGLTVEVLDKRVCPGVPELDPALVPWMSGKWDFQRHALFEVLRKGGRGLLKSSTGSGKTDMFVGLTRLVPCEWLFIVHRADLVEQTRERFALRTGERAGVWRKGRWERGTSNATVCTFQSLATAKRKKNKDLGAFLRSFHGVNIDEVHAQPADSFYACTLSLVNAFYRIGMSGTPLDRTDWENLRTIGSLGPLLHTIPREYLVKLKILSESEVHMVKFKHEPTEEGVSWASVYRDLIARNTKRNELLADIAEHADKPCMLFVKHQDHGKRLKKLLLARGVKTDFAYGPDSLDARKRKIRTLEDGTVDVMVCSVIFQEGVDVPTLRSVVIAAAGASWIAALQRIGRGMRVDKPTNKWTFQVWDILDRGQGWLTRHATSRKDALEADGHEVRVITQKFFCKLPTSR